MKREVKLALLKGIKGGILTKEHLEPAQVYIFFGQVIQDASDLNKVTYKMNGRDYSDKERIDFITNIEHKNNALSILGNVKFLENLKDTCISILFM